METLTPTRDLVAELSRVEGKAEIVRGKIVHLPMTGLRPGYAGDMIHFALQTFVFQTRRGFAVSDNKGFLVRLPHRRSFSPDAAFYTGPDTGMKFCQDAPAFAAEVRSEDDYGPAAEREMEEKRADYLAAGTLVVWDVDTLSEDVVRVYRDGDAARPAAVYRRGQTAEAEPAVPGWTMPVEMLFVPGQGSTR